MNELIEFLGRMLDEDEAAALAQQERDAAAWQGESFAPFYPGIPARVLAEVNAKRAIVAEHGLLQYWGTESRPRCATCAVWDENDYDGPPDVEWPCPTLRALASVYRGADGWQEAWA